MRHRACRLSLILLVCSLLCSLPGLFGASALAADSTGDYARYYGDGLRHFAEGDFAEAVEHLFRAYALEPEASTMGLIVASYDKMGFCDAAKRQLDVHRLVHPDAKAPSLDRCKATGTVAITCEGPEAPVTVDRQFQVACGQRVALPVGEHRLSAERIDAPEMVVVQKDQTANVALIFAPAPERWKSAAKPPAISKLPDANAKVARLEKGGLGYTVFQSRDGLYRVFIHPSAGDSGHLISLPLRPDVLRLCDSGDQFDRKSGQCVPVEGMQIQKME